MRTQRSVRHRAGLALLLLVAAACGQKPGVSSQPSPPQPAVIAGLPPGATIDPDTGQIVDAEGNVLGTVDDFTAGSLSGRDAGVSADTSSDPHAPSAASEERHGEAPAPDVAGSEHVYVLTSPFWFMQVLQESRAQGFSPQWVGVGLTKALDTVASVGCRNGTLSRAKFFSPFPAWADIDRFDPDFKRAVRQVFPEEDNGDDIMLIPWGMSLILEAFLDAPGRNLTRERFTYHAQRVRNLKTGVFPAVSFTPDDHFGGTQVHVNEAHCSGHKTGDNRWHTIHSFVSDF